MSTRQPTEPATAEGVAVISVWTDDGGFRARVTVGAGGSDPRVTVVSSREQVLELVDAWLAGGASASSIAD